MMSEDEKQEALEHRDVLLSLRAILTSEAGKKFVKYLFKHLDVGEVPPFGLEGFVLAERLGLARAGNAVFKIACEADHEVAAKLLAELEKEKYDRLYRERRNEERD